MTTFTEKIKNVEITYTQDDMKKAVNKAYDDVYKKFINNSVTMESFKKDDFVDKILDDFYGGEMNSICGFDYFLFKLVKSHIIHFHTYMELIDHLYDYERLIAQPDGSITKATYDDCAEFMYWVNEKMDLYNFDLIMDHIFVM